MCLLTKSERLNKETLSFDVNRAALANTRGLSFSPLSFFMSAAVEIRTVDVGVLVLW